MTITYKIVEKALHAGSINSKGFTRIAMRDALVAVLPDLTAAATANERAACIADLVKFREDMLSKYPTEYDIALHCRMRSTSFARGAVKYEHQ